MGYKPGDTVRLKQDSDHYTGKYAGTQVTIHTRDTDQSCTVTGYDGYRFMCPIAYFEDDDFGTWNPPPIPRICECGAHKTYGKDCPPFFHYDFCTFYRPPKE